ncbi:MAG: respiratory nitrate reductase subunit gamma [Deltaproteobacteria bacterium]|nr:respiratory nitrate reductase subunit gamma [Deltaproteobacteria bacterium]
MDWFSYLVAGIMVYVAGAIFILGMTYQIYQWLRAPKTRIKTGVFPKPGSAVTRWGEVAIDSFTFPQAMKADRTMWVFTILFHFALLGAFVGHLRLIHEITPLFNFLGTQGMDQFAFWSGSLMGILLMVALIYYLLRRLVSPYKEISVPEDFILLLLLILVVVMGDYMRFLGKVHTTDYRAYLQSLIALRPAFPKVLADSSTKWALVLHVLFANLLFIYFPFSKLVHLIATFPANLARRV